MTEKNKISFTTKELFVIWTTLNFYNSDGSQIRKIPREKELIALETFRILNKGRTSVEQGVKFNEKGLNAELGTEMKSLIIEYINTIERPISLLEAKVSILNKLK